MTALEHAMSELGAKRDEPLARHTFVQVGGPADWLVTARNRAELVRAVVASHDHQLPLYLLGAGSNVLIRDGGIRGLVVKNESRDCSLVPGADPDTPGCLIEIDSGARFARVARETARAGLTGLEWAAGIPGALGGGLPTNAGAYGGDLAQVLESARAVTADGSEITLLPDDLDLRYRDSALRSGIHSGLVVISLCLRLHRADPQAALAEIERVERLRKTNAPAGPSLGSTFKNPPNIQLSAGALIEQAGLGGHRIGAAEVSTLHANYIRNRAVGRARASDFIRLIEYVQARVQDRFNVRLEPEITIVGEELA